MDDVPKGQPVPPVDAENAERNLPMSTTSMPETNPRTGRFSPLARMGIVVGDELANQSSFTRSSKRRKGYPSETQVKRGHRIVRGDKELSRSLDEPISVHAVRDGGF
jgi:hypothetical protein